MTSHPLAVMLGTITPQGEGDVYCYRCDDMVINPFLTDHMNHFGVQGARLPRQPSLSDLEISLNSSNVEWDNFVPPAVQAEMLDQQPGNEAESEPGQAPSSSREPGAWHRS
eukprot:TRINITY_DN8823_c0_g1_i1.p1 TRINITY_DN8823_c0_g1~~TRINITY_DN8823_c0_g1_i1.p1  ORF type:complete len:123 (-),score=42.67 TRINITY_DN8823_c0_g1_i1:233-565(-)